jgi:hypothetical protein
MLIFSKIYWTVFSSMGDKCKIEKKMANCLQLIFSPTLPEWQADGVVALHRDGHDSQDATV